MKKRNNLYYESQGKARGFELIAGIDEAGRGPLAGPVVAAAVILCAARFKNRIDDSKKLTSIQRLNAYLEIIEKCKVGIGIVSESAIDQINIFQATKAAMEIAADGLCKSLKDNFKKLLFLIDGNVDINLNYPSRFIVAGDQKSRSIAAASIIAKVTRDRIMMIYDKVWPEYGFIRHKGYGTEGHRRAIEKFGPVLIHRRSFAPLRGLNEQGAPDFR